MHKLQDVGEPNHADEVSKPIGKPVDIECLFEAWHVGLLGGGSGGNYQEVIAMDRNVVAHNPYIR